MRYRRCANIKGVILTKKMQENGCVLGQRMYYSTTILENFRCYLPFSSSFVKKRVLFGKICKRNSVSPTSKCKRKAVFFRECRRRKGIGEVSLTMGAGGLKNWAKFTIYFLRSPPFKVVEILRSPPQQVVEFL